MIGDNIKNSRKKLGMTQEQLGKEVNVSAAMISQWERGERKPKLENLKKISKVLKVNLDYLSDDGAVELGGGLYRRSPKTLGSYVIDDVFERIGVDVNKSDIQISKEQQLIDLFEQLNEQGKIKAIENVAILTKVPEYQEIDPDHKIIY